VLKVEDPLPEAGARPCPYNESMRSRVERFIFLVVFTAAFLRVASAIPPREQFLGPFPSWKNLKRDYGAVGDGNTDDTAAIQRALDELTTHKTSCVLYIPAGTYRITSTVKTVRKAHTDCQGVAVIGEHPVRTVLKWDGPPGGTMFAWDAWYSKISRLSFDGGGKAGVGLLYGPSFSTYNETSDLWFQGVRNGIVFGGPNTAGQAENAVLRCRFSDCDVGIQTVNWNSMDIWVWQSTFDDCGTGILNVMGNWHAWKNAFFRSKTADVSIRNLMVFSVVGNTSIGSKCFLDFRCAHSWGSPTSITQNRVLDPTGPFAVYLDDAGPYLVCDNQFRLGPASKAIRMTWGDQIFVGNSYSSLGAVEERGRFRRVAERTVKDSQIDGRFPYVPQPPEVFGATVRIEEVPAGATEELVQAAVDRAARGDEPAVVHLPMGIYTLNRTLVIPARSPVEIVGDSAGETGTRLNWSGPAGGVAIRLAGPSRATLRDLYVNAPNASAILVDDADQAGGRIFADQLNTTLTGASVKEGAAALLVDGLDHADVFCRALQGSGHAGHWVEAIGGPAGEHGANQISVFNGATGSAVGQYEVRNGARLIVRGVYHEKDGPTPIGLRLTDRGTLCIDATRFSYATSPGEGTFTTDGFRGMLTLATSQLLPVDNSDPCRFEMLGDGSATSVLALCNLFWQYKPGLSSHSVWRNEASPAAAGGMLDCNVNGDQRAGLAHGSAIIDDVAAAVSDQTILNHLAPLRKARLWLDGPVPRGATYVRFYRVMVACRGDYGVAIQRGR